MNINTGCYFDAFDEQTLASDVKEHHEILGRSGDWTLTGEVAFLPSAEPDLAASGVMAVWSKTADGMWVWINELGEAVEAACPMGD